MKLTDYYDERLEAAKEHLEMAIELERIEKVEKDLNNFRTGNDITVGIGWHDDEEYFLETLSISRKRVRDMLAAEKIYLRDCLVSERNRLEGEK